jgi:hypothetical protein
MGDPVLLQRNYYRTTAGQYDRIHNSSADAHAFALAVLVSMIDFFEIQSIARHRPGVKNSPDRGCTLARVLHPLAQLRQKSPKAGIVRGERRRMSVGAMMHYRSLF